MKRTLKKFITIGEPMAMFTANEPGDLALVETFTKRLAGAELNVAIGMARLGFHSRYMTKLGQDSFGSYIEQAVKAEGVDTSLFTYSSEKRTGFQLKSKELEGDDPTVEYFRKDSAASNLQSNEHPESVFSDDLHLHLTGVAAAVSPSLRALCHKALDSAKASGNSVSFDTNLRPALWSSTKQMVEEINAIAFKSDIVLPGISEGKVLTGFDTPEEIANFYLRQGVKMVVVKLGGDGAYYKLANGESGMKAGNKVASVVDTVGAGDSFAVGVVSAWLENMQTSEAIERGNLFGALAVQVLGDSEGLPTRAELDAMTVKDN